MSSFNSLVSAAGGRLQLAVDLLASADLSNVTISGLNEGFDFSHRVLAWIIVDRKRRVG
ncbi:MAG: hypothetical protein JOY54_18035 [Acidobacteriaceae bacterium]|nr:hypothetical protein [Acidobacteriaceae bacterium]